METILASKNDKTFGVTNQFSSKFLIPIIKNVLEKANSNWDDYDEVFHCTRLIEKINQNKNMSIDYHFMREKSEIVGILMATTGELEDHLFFGNEFEIPCVKSEVVILNYFHIAPEGRGNGGFWLKDIVLPYYQNKGFKSVYVKSSHPQAFSLYERLGAKIGKYQVFSDNQLYLREGEIFRIPLQG